MASKTLAWQAPIAEMLVRHISLNPASFHVPGHKYGQLLSRINRHASGGAFIHTLQQMMAFDITELSGTDDLHEPHGVIAEAQQLAAKCFGAEETHFLVGGSTSGNLAMLLGCCEPDELILVQRNVHKSVLHGLELAGLRAVFLAPDIELSSGLPLPPSLAAVEQALQLYPQAKAVFLSNPSYYGLSVDLRPYSEVIHQADAMLLVDEAHGAHYGLHPALPRSALQAGADAAVQSTHKTLGAMTMGAMLHIQGERVNRSMVRRMLTMIQSSSPSYPIMASLDIARAMMDTAGPDLLEEGITAAEAFREWIAGAESGGINTAVGVIQQKQLDSRCKLDPLRVVLYDRTRTITGYEMLQLLERSGCWAEMADQRYAVLLFPIAAMPADIDKLKTSLIAAADLIANQQGMMLQSQQATWRERQQGQQEQQEQQGQQGLYSYEAISQPVVFPRGRMEQQTEQVPIAQAVNRLTANAVIPYPPGIPMLYRGECINSRMIGHLQELAQAGARFQGAYHPDKGTIEVLCDR